METRLYRQVVDRMLARRHHLTDFFFSLPPLEPRSRLDRIFSLAKTSVVELETHPVMPDEYKFLRGGEMRHQVEEALAGVLRAAANSMQASH